MLVFFIGQILLLQYFTFVTSEGVTEADIRDSKGNWGITKLAEENNLFFVSAILRPLN